MLRKTQLLIAAILAESDAIICREAWLRHPNWPLTLLVWFFAIVSIVACWKLIGILEKE